MSKFIQILLLFMVTYLLSCSNQNDKRIVIWHSLRPAEREILRAVVITALFSFMAAWSEYLVAAVLIQDQQLFTLPLGLKLFQSSMEVSWGLHSAGAVIVSLPVVTLFIILSRWLVSGLTLGSIKG